MSRRTVSLLVAVVLVGVAAAFGGAASPRTAPPPGRGGMMGAGGMMGGAFGGTAQSAVTPAELRAVRVRVERQLAGWGYAPFAVAEIMAFANNDYVLVEDASGRPAFELLADPGGRWLMPEPTMMWNTSYGLMHGLAAVRCPWGTGATGPANGQPLTAAEAKSRADAWLAAHRPGEAAADATALPGYFTIDVARNGAKVGMLSVSSRSGAVWFHTWHGRFLADRDF